MTAATGPMSLSSRSGLVAAIAGGTLAGAIDLTYATSFHGLVNHIAPIRILQSIASGLFGVASFQMGYASAAAGFAAHFIILIVAAGIFGFARRRIALLREHAYPAGMAFGVAIYCTMNYVVLPLSAAPHFKSAPVAAISDFAVHVLLLGPAISLVAKRFDRRVAS
ncbi:MAG TPA: hypothetical protein VJ696_14585 [Rhodanobacteraceae bacterium]|nr:hypothetical protein [Rhodanobacteraceae bacterium]